METKKHCIKTIESTTQAVGFPKALAHNPLKVSSPVNSHDLPINPNVCAETNASIVQIIIDGIQPVFPLAFPAAKVRIPAPATLLDKLKIEVRMVAPLLASAVFFEGDDGDVFWGCFVAVLLAVPPPLLMLRKYR